MLKQKPPLFVCFVKFQRENFESYSVKHWKEHQPENNVEENKEEIKFS